MNRLILIGNGFDKAHGLKTSYQDFMLWYWDKWKMRLFGSLKMEEEDCLCYFKLKEDVASSWNMVSGFVYNRCFASDLSGIELKECLKGDKERCEFKWCRFLENINKSIESKGWVDIEEEYYSILKAIVLGQYPTDDANFGHPEKLNDELSKLTEYLIEYLTEVQNNRNCDTNQNIAQILYGPVLSEDISVSNQLEFKKHVLGNLKLDIPIIARLNKRFYGNCVESQMRDLREFKQNNYAETMAFDKITSNRCLSEYLSFPDRVLLLSFNYTDTESLYTQDKYGVEVVHIHGELNDPDSVIFGYGDELDDAYSKMQKANVNEYLKNIKSIRYLESGKYRKVLKFIESAPYQIYILGHSCGTSDRTLLNTLFEHRNCVSVKPYYFVKDGKDNYLDIIENISRNFTDMKRMRDVVVNKELCSRIPQSSGTI